MKNTIATLFLLATFSAKAQDFKAASLHLDMAGKHQQAGIIVPLIAGLVAAGIATQVTDTQGPAIILGAGFAVGVSFSLSSASHTRKAGKALHLRTP